VEASTNPIWGGTHIIWSIGLGAILLLWLGGTVMKAWTNWRTRRGGTEE
jgi:hypothetical protein